MSAPPTTSEPAGGRILFIQLPDAPAPALDALLADRLSGTGRCIRNRSLHDMVQRGFKLWSTPGLRYLSGQVPACLLPLASSDRAFTVLRRPSAPVAPPVNGERRGQFGSYFAPGFDDHRLRVETQIGIALALEAYADACTSEQALRTLSRLSAVVDAGRLRSAAMQLLMTLSLPPPLVLPAGLTDDREDPATGADADESGFDMRIFDAAMRRAGSSSPGEVQSAYERYIQRYCAEAGWPIGPHETIECPLGRPLGQHWHAAEPGDDGRHFRWSADTPPTLELPIRHPGWYSVRLYLFNHGLQEVGATVTTFGESRSSRMSELRHGQGQVLDAHLHLREPGWIVVQFEHGAVPERPGADQRRRGFVLGRVLLRCLSN